MTIPAWAVILAIIVGPSAMIWIYGIGWSRGFDRCSRIWREESR